MTTALKFFKVNTLPEPQNVVADALYYVKHPTKNYAESYISASDGSLRSLGNSAMINDLIDDKLTAMTSGLSNLVFADDIDARDIIISNTEKNVMILVSDASDDPTVVSGAAMYAFNYDTYDADTNPSKEYDDHTIKVAEYESLDLQFTWSAISGKPASDVGDIDEAVNWRHQHINKTSLDKIGEDGQGRLLYNGQAVTSDPVWTDADW